MKNFNGPEYQGYETAPRLLAAIEAVTGGNLLARGHEHPETCTDPAVKLWVDGGREDELRTWLDRQYPDWRDDAPLTWGLGELESPDNGRAGKWN